MPRILVVSGSPRKDSINRRAAAFTHHTLEKAGVEVDVFDVREAALPMFEGYDESEMAPGVQAMRRQFAAADGYIFHVPEYHNAIPAATKNVFEHLSRGARSATRWPA